jgi:hypothetical protein
MFHFILAEDLAERYAAIGVVGFIQKPFSRATLHFYTSVCGTAAQNMSAYARDQQD